MIPNTERAKNIIFCIRIFLVIQCMVIIAMLGQYYYINEFIHGNYHDEAFFKMGIRSMILYILQIAIFVACVITFILWFYRAYSNIGKRGQKLNYSKGWTLWSWIVPILNFYLPYKIMKEMHLKTNDFLKCELVNEEKPAIAVVRWWWGLWIFYVISAGFIADMLSKSKTFEEMLYLIGWSVFISLSFILLCIVTIRMINNYNNMETKLLNVTISEPLKSADTNLD